MLNNLTENVTPIINRFLAHPTGPKNAPELLELHIFIAKLRESGNIRQNRNALRAKGRQQRALAGLILADGLIRIIDASVDMSAQHGGHNFRRGVIRNIFQIHTTVQLNQARTDLVLSTGARTAHCDFAGVGLCVFNKLVHSLILSSGENPDGIFIHGEIADRGQFLICNAASSNHRTRDLCGDIRGNGGAVRLFCNSIGITHGATAARFVVDCDGMAAKHS